MFAEEKTRIANHAPEGVFAVLGPSVRKGEQIYGARAAGITPTILRMLGFGLLKSMDGKPLDIFLPGGGESVDVLTGQHNISRPIMIDVPNKGDFHEAPMLPEFKHQIPHPGRSDHYL
jgi:hypothetical protein